MAFSPKIVNKQKRGNYISQGATGAAGPWEIEERWREYAIWYKAASDAQFKENG